MLQDIDLVKLYLKTDKYSHPDALAMAETFMSGMKRTMGSTLNATIERGLMMDAAMKVLAYAIRRSVRTARRTMVSKPTLPRIALRKIVFFTSVRSRCRPGPRV